MRQITVQTACSTELIGTENFVNHYITSLTIIHVSQGERKFIVVKKPAQYAAYFMYVILASVNHWNDEGFDAIFSSKVLIYSKKIALELVDFADREIFRSFGENDFCWKTDLHEI